MTLLVAAEDRAGFAAVQTLTDRLLVDEVPWVDGILDHSRVWLHATEDRPWLSITAARRNARGSRRRIHGHFGGEPGAPDAANTRRILLEATQVHSQEMLHVLVIARDLDGDRRRLRGMQQAVDDGEWPFRVVLAWSEPEAEAWYLSGFCPGDETERARLHAVHEELGFDPTSAPQRLRSTSKRSKKDAKIVLEKLSSGNVDRERACLENTPIADLVARGEEAGLADFIKSVREKILPLFGAGGSSLRR